jgi:hypothetical protein
MTLTITIEMDNAAFEEEGSGNEVGRILRCVAGRLTDDDVTEDTGFNLFDINGNKVGSVEVTG